MADGMTREERIAKIAAQPKRARAYCEKTNQSLPQDVIELEWLLGELTVYEKALRMAAAHADYEYWLSEARKEVEEK